MHKSVLLMIVFGTLFNLYLGCFCLAKINDEGMNLVSNYPGRVEFFGVSFGWGELHKWVLLLLAFGTLFNLYLGWAYFRKNK